MNKIVLEHYPASKLPEELRKGFDDRASVRVTVEEERRAFNKAEFLASLQKARKNAKGVSIEEAVARIRELRDEWDD